MARSFDAELLDKMLAKPFLPNGLIDRLRKAKSDIEKVEIPVRNELLAEYNKLATGGDSAVYLGHLVTTSVRTRLQALVPPQKPRNFIANHVPSFP